MVWGWLFPLNQEDMLRSDTYSKTKKKSCERGCQGRRNSYYWVWSTWGKRTISSCLKTNRIQLNTANVLPSDLLFDYLWHTSSFLPNPCPGWSGYMSDVSVAHSHPGKAAILMLPTINLNLNNMYCIYSTLCFIESQAWYLQIVTPVATFYQPFWMKATEIINEKSMVIRCILGVLHFLMSFLDSIGGLMKSSSLEEALGVVFDENTVSHKITGKPLSRAVRGHFLV